MLRVLDDGHDIAEVFTFPTDNTYNFNTFVTTTAQVYGIPFTLDKPTAADITRLRDSGVDLFLSCAYANKIPVPDDDPTFRGINLHPTLLPQVRGVWPLPIVMLKHPDAAGFTFHKLTNKWDAGDILYQQALPLRPDEDLETLSARLVMAVPDQLSMLLNNLDHYWQSAQPQDVSKASYYTYPPDTWRVFDFNGSVDEIDRIGRAYGRFECIAPVDTKMYWVRSYKAWKERHDYKPGSITCRTGRELVVAAKDGFVCLKDFYEAQ